MGVETSGYLYGYSEQQLQALLDSLFADITDIRLAEMRADVVAGINRLPLRERQSLVYKAAGYSDAQVGRKLGVARSVLKRLQDTAFTRLLVFVNLGMGRQLRKVA